MSRLFKKAIELYQRAFEEIPDVFKEEKAKINSNIAICFLKQEKYNEVVFFSSEALNLSPNYVKPKVNRAEAYYHKKEYEKCLAGILNRL